MSVNTKHNLLHFSLIQVFTIGILLTVMHEKYVWYLLPAFPFVSYIIVFTSQRVINYFPPYRYIIFLLLIFTLIRHFIYLNSPEEKLHALFGGDLFNNTKTPVVIVDFPNQSTYLKLLWTGRNIHHEPKKYEAMESNVVFCVNKSKVENMDYARCYGNYCFVKSGLR